MRTFVCKAVVLVLPLWLVACALPKYTELSLPSPPGALPPSAKRLLVVLDPVLPGHPISETVWDNIDGPLWSPEESKKIGFTQHYQVPTAAFAPQPVRVGLFASGQASFVSSRIMAPYGRLLAASLETEAAARGIRAILCFTTECASREESLGGIHQKLLVHIDAAAIAETRTNHLSMAARGSVDSSSPGSAVLQRSFNVRIEDRSITENGLFHADFLRAMNAIAGEFSAKVAGAILDTPLP